jgi:DNA polymerase I-like protein with 3'-5' exonuclease and polymerase domains
MTLDLSYINEQPSEAQEEAIKRAVETECLRAISMYLTEVADAMEANGIETLNVPSLRAMANQFSDRINDGESKAN